MKLQTPDRSETCFKHIHVINNDRRYPILSDGGESENIRSVGPQIIGQLFIHNERFITKWTCVKQDNVSRKQLVNFGSALQLAVKVQSWSKFKGLPLAPMALQCLQHDLTKLCCAVYSGRNSPMFQKCFLPPSSGRFPLIMETAIASKTSVNFYQTTWCSNPQR
jgi:hypothetical protein